MSLKTFKIIVLVLCFATNIFSSIAQELEKTNGRDWDIPKSPKWEQLKKEPIPEWMIDAKFGVYTHWGNIFSASSRWSRLRKRIICA